MKVPSTSPLGILELACDYGYEELVPALVEARDRRVAVICRSGNRRIDDRIRRVAETDHYE